MLNKIRAALRYIDPDCSRHDWIKVGLALRHHFHGDDSRGLALYDEWSSGSLSGIGSMPTSYSSATLERQWDSFLPSGNVTVVSIFYLAFKSGWKGETP